MVLVTPKANDVPVTITILGLWVDNVGKAGDIASVLQADQRSDLRGATAATGSAGVVAAIQAHEPVDDGLGGLLGIEMA